MQLSECRSAIVCARECSCLSVVVCLCYGEWLSECRSSVVCVMESGCLNVGAQLFVLECEIG